MESITRADRKATAEEVRANGNEIRHFAARIGLGDPRLRDDGTIVVHSDDPGYRVVLELSGFASSLVGTYVHVITDDAPAASGARPL